MKTPHELWLSSQYSWKEVESIQISPMVIYRGKVASRYGAYTHPYYTWWWIAAGSVKLEIPRNTLHIDAGRWVFIPVGTRRIQRFSEDCRLISVNFFAQWPNGLPLLSLSQPVIGDEASCPALRKLATRICTVLEQNQGGENHLRNMKLTIPEVLAVKSGLYNFVNTLFEYIATQGGNATIASQEDPRLAMVLDWIQANMRAGPLPFEEWRQQTGLGRSQLENLSRHHLRMSLSTYRNQLLVAEACRRLGIHSVLVKQVAEELGFVDSSHFCRWLRKHTGRSPADFRNQHA